MKDRSRAWTALTQFRDAAEDYFKEREELILCGLLALLANCHLFILGPPGAAKSMLAEVLGAASGKRPTPIC